MGGVDYDRGVCEGGCRARDIGFPLWSVVRESGTVGRRGGGVHVIVILEEFGWFRRVDFDVSTILQPVRLHMWLWMGASGVRHFSLPARPPVLIARVPGVPRDRGL